MAKADVLAQLREQIQAIESSKDDAFSAHRERQFADTEAAKKRPGKDAAFDGDDKNAAFKKVVALVNVSDRSEKTVRERLAKAGFSEPAIEDAVSRSKDYGFIDDARFAEVLVRSRISQGKGSDGIERELRSHDIDASIVPGWPFEYPVSHEEEVDRALGLLDRKPPRSKNARDGAYRKLVGKGYPSSVAATAARMWVEQRSE